MNETTQRKINDIIKTIWFKKLDDEFYEFIQTLSKEGEQKIGHEIKERLHKELYYRKCTNIDEAKKILKIIQNEAMMTFIYYEEEYLLWGDNYSRATWNGEYELWQ